MIRSRDFREGVVLRRRGLMPPHVRLTVWTTRGCIRIGRGLVLCRASRRCSPEKGVVSNACTRLYCREVALYERSKLPAACWCVREGGRVQPQFCFHNGLYLTCCFCYFPGYCDCRRIFHV